MFRIDNNVTIFCRCQVFWMDSTGHPRTSSSLAQVSVGALDFEMAIDRVGQLEALTDQCLKSKTNLTLMLEKTRVELNNVNAQNLNLSSLFKSNIAETDGLQDFFHANREILGFKSTFHNGHTYYLSPKYNSLGLTASDKICQLFNGYLVEINDQSEYDFVANYIKQNAYSTDVILGARDDGHESQWTFVHSGLPVPLLLWAKEEPNGGKGDNCLLVNFDYGGDGGMLDLCCECGIQGRFLCEIPAH